MHDYDHFTLGLQEIVDFDESELIDRLLHQGTIDLLARTKCTARCLDLRVKAGVDEYKLDHAVLALIDVDDGMLPRARRDQTSYSPSFTLIRSDMLRLQPGPSEDGLIQSWAVMRPDPMVEDDDSPSSDKFGGIPDEYQDAILMYALWKGAEYANDQASVQGERYRVAYEGQDSISGRVPRGRRPGHQRGPP